MNFDRLPDDLAAQITLGLNGLDVTRLSATSRSFKQLLKVLWSGTEGDEDTSRPGGLHYWSRLERSTRTQHRIPTADAAPWQAAFQDVPLAAQNGANAANPPANQQGQPAVAVPQPNIAALAALQAFLGDDGQDAEQLPQFHVANNRTRFRILTAAGLIGGWWGPQAENDGGAALGAALQLLQECLGEEVTAVVRHVLDQAGANHPAHSFWGSMFLGLLLSTTKSAHRGGANLLMQQLLLLETGGCSTVISSVVPVRITAELSSRDSTLQNQGTHSGWIEPPCPSRYVGYQLREFLSAVLVLLRLEPLQAQQLQNQSAVDQLQYEVLQVLLAQDAVEQDAAALSLRDLFGQQADQYRASLQLPKGVELTREQVHIITGAIRPREPGQTGDIVPVNAYAGTAKTFTLRALTMAHPRVRFLYTAYNKSVVDEASRIFPPNVICRTTHRLAGPAMRQFQARRWKLGATLYIDDVWRRLQAIPFYRTRVAQGGTGPSRQVAVVVKDIIEKFTASADEQIQEQHMPGNPLPLLRDPPPYTEVAQQYWDLFRNGTAPWGTVFTHNMYLKAFVMDLAMSAAQFEDQFDAILIDEAQDMNAVTLQMLMTQTCTRILVGDRYQHIYSFNFCSNALDGDAEAAAARAGTLPSSILRFSLTNSFRLGPAVAEVANRLLWQLGERKRPMIGAGYKQAAVYELRLQDPAAQADPELNPAAADVGQLDAAAVVHCEQMQVLQTAIETTDKTPEQLEMMSLTIRSPRGDKVVHLAKPPINPATGRFYGPLWYITRYNTTWFEVCVALVSRHNSAVQPPAVLGEFGHVLGDLIGDGGDVDGQHHGHGPEGGAIQAAGAAAPAAGAVDPAAAVAAAAAGPPPRIYLTAIDERTGQVQFLTQLMELANFRSGDLDRFRHYQSWHELVEAVTQRQDTDLLASIGIVEFYGSAVLQLVEAIGSALVHDKRDADYILGTCHKAKGGQEDYVQLADDFMSIRRARSMLVEKDEFNLVYVAATRAKLSLVCNLDVQQLLQQADQRSAVLQVQNVRTNAQQCGRCGRAIPVADAWGPLRPTLSAGWQEHPHLPSGVDDAVDVLNILAQQQDQLPMCWRCMDEISLWGQLGAVQQDGQDEAGN